MTPLSHHYECTVTDTKSPRYYRGYKNKVMTTFQFSYDTNTLLVKNSSNDRAMRSLWACPYLQDYTHDIWCIMLYDMRNCVIFKESGTDLRKKRKIQWVADAFCASAFQATKHGWTSADIMPHKEVRNMVSIETSVRSRSYRENLPSTAGREYLTTAVQELPLNNG